MSTDNRKNERHRGRRDSSKGSISIASDRFYDCDERGREVGEGVRIVRASVPIVVRHHRDVPGGQSLSVGEVSAGSLDLALNVLVHLYPPARDGAEPKRCRINFASATAFDLHERFCREFLAPMDPEGEEISVAKIKSWVQRQTCSTDR